MGRGQAVLRAARGPDPCAAPTSSEAPPRAGCLGAVSPFLPPCSAIRPLCESSALALLPPSPAICPQTPAIFFPTQAFHSAQP